ncbi:PH domain-containing protein [Nonomuraea sp. KM88]|uniref:PH domain-containing protein n=1 Tax=Nonomuraea sp. KM88 TaxID=3457427 RepID=UPI003FCDA023
MNAPGLRGQDRNAPEAARHRDGQDGWRRLSGRSLWVSGTKSLALVAGAVAGLTRFLLGLDWQPGWIVAACVGAAVLILAAVPAYDLARLRTTRWRLTAERLELRSGLTTRQHRSIPRDRVRSVDLRADPVLRMFGLTVVKVGTGEHAAEHTELTLDPLARNDAETLRRTLLRREEEREARDGPLAELRWSWIRYAPLSVWTFTASALVLGALYKPLNALGFKSVTSRAAGDLWGWIVARPLTAVPLLLAVNLAVGVLGAVLLFAESWGRYRLEHEPGRLRLRRGLLTTRSLTLELRRLRGVEISEPLLLRLGGGARVRTVATGLGEKAANETEDAAALAPPLPRDRAWRLAAEVAGAGGGHPAGVPGPRVPAAEVASAGVPVSRVLDAGAELIPHPLAARRRRVIRALLATALAAALAAVAAGAASWPAPWPWVRAWVWLIPVVVLAAGMWGAVEGARNLGHALGARHLVSRSGAVVRRTVALDRRGIAGWTITESYFQRLSGLLTVSATTSAGRGHYEVVDVGRGTGLDLASSAVPGLLEPFLVRGKTVAKQ